MDEWVRREKMWRDQAGREWGKHTFCKRTCQGMVVDVRPLALCRNTEQFSSKLHCLFFFGFFGKQAGLLLQLWPFCNQPFVVTVTCFVIISWVQPQPIMATALLQNNLCCLSFHLCCHSALRPPNFYQFSTNAVKPSLVFFRILYLCLCVCGFGQNSIVGPLSHQCRTCPVLTH